MFLGEFLPNDPAHSAWSSLRTLLKLRCQFHCSGAIAQLGERIVRNDEVVGSIPTSSTIFSSTYRPSLTQSWSIPVQKQISLPQFCLKKLAQEKTKSPNFQLPKKSEKVRTLGSG